MPDHDLDRYLEVSKDGDEVMMNFDDDDGETICEIAGEKQNERLKAQTEQEF